jgi:cellulose synthase/poly-beta-1,6-N-acetylglucosamine synthase-like glycosyltransferase
VQHKLYKLVCNYVYVGPMVWYQKFEYALGHWLQKATEHVIGCVLCSPGCFSLFRGEALMDDNVMHKYTTMSTDARHFVQYDQGKTAQHLSSPDILIKVSSN